MESTEPIKTQKSNFVEFWSKAEESNIKLGAALLTLMVTCFTLSMGLVYQTMKPKPIYYIPGAWEAGAAMPETLPKTAVVAFVSSWALNWSNFTPATVTPATVESVYGRAQRFMAPQLLAQTHVRLKKDLEEVKKNNISSFFSLNEEPAFIEEGHGFKVILKGDKGIYVGKEEISVQKMTYKVRIRRVSPTEINPYGLLIESIEQESV
jgi:hypothetical protein